MVTRRAWVLNFDAEVELEALGRRRPPTRSRRAMERWPELQARVSELLGPHDEMLDEIGGPRLSDCEGRAWCPTPSACAALAERGAIVPPHPAPELLREVNHRRFNAELGVDLPGARFVDTEQELQETVARPSISGPWLIKRALSFTGQGRIRTDPGPLSEAAWAFCRTSLRAGDGLSVEPYVTRLGDYSLHGYLAEDGGLTVGEIVEQRVGATGVWLSAAPAEPGALDERERNALFEALNAAARALCDRGYFGPFGIDAFRYRGPDGTPRFHPRCEINARYSMAWAVGMGSRRPDLELQSGS